MDPNRLHLNLGAGQGQGQGHQAGAFNSDRTYQAANSHVYPTTPSTFPQPIFQSQQRGQQANNEYLAAAQLPGPAAGYGQGGYFAPNSQYQPPRGGQQPNAGYGRQYEQQTQMQSPQPSYRGGFATNDPNSGLARQFSNQNLGSNQRQASPFGRHPSPNQQARPRTGGATSGQPQGGHLGVPMSGIMTGSQSSLTEEPPEPDPEKYSSNIGKTMSGLHVFVKQFFEDNVTRARDRNGRSVAISLPRPQTVLWGSPLTVLPVVLENSMSSSKIRQTPKLIRRKSVERFGSQKHPIFVSFAPWSQ